MVDGSIESLRRETILDSVYFDSDDGMDVR